MCDCCFNMCDCRLGGKIRVLALLCTQSVMCVTVIATCVTVIRSQIRLLALLALTVCHVRGKL